MPVVTGDWLFVCRQWLVIDCLCVSCSNSVIYVFQFLVETDEHTKEIPMTVDQFSPGTIASTSTSTAASRVPVPPLVGYQYRR